MTIKNKNLRGFVGKGLLLSTANTYYTHLVLYYLGSTTIGRLPQNVQTITKQTKALILSTFLTISGSMYLCYILAWWEQEVVWFSQAKGARNILFSRSLQCIRWTHVEYKITMKTILAQSALCTPTLQVLWLHIFGTYHLTIDDKLNTLERVKRSVSGHK